MRNLNALINFSSQKFALYNVCVLTPDRVACGSRLTCLVSEKLSSTWRPFFGPLCTDQMEHDRDAGSWKGSRLHSSRRHGLVWKVSCSIAWWPTNWSWVQFSIGLLSGFYLLPSFDCLLFGVKLFFPVPTAYISAVIIYTTAVVLVKLCFMPHSLFTCFMLF